MRAPRSAVVIVATITMFVVSIGLAITWLIVGRQTDDRDAAARSQDPAIEAARETAVAINSYDYRAIDDQLRDVQGRMTGALLENFQKTKDSVRAGFVSAQIVSNASVVAVGSVSIGAHDATVLVWLAVNTTTDGKSSAQNAPLRVHLVERNSTWLADKIATVG